MDTKVSFVTAHPLLALTLSKKVGLYTIPLDTTVQVIRPRLATV